MDAKFLQKARKIFASGDYSDQKKAVNFLIVHGDYSRDEAWETLTHYYLNDPSRLYPEIRKT